MPATVARLLEDCPEFWESQELRDSMASGQLLGLAPAFWAQASYTLQLCRGLGLPQLEVLWGGEGCAGGGFTKSILKGRHAVEVVRQGRMAVRVCTRMPQPGKDGSAELADRELDHMSWQVNGHRMGYLHAAAAQAGKRARHHTLPPPPGLVCTSPLLLQPHTVPTCEWGCPDTWMRLP